MSKFIRLLMFKDQNSKKGRGNDYGQVALPTQVVKAFPQWKGGHFLKSARSESTEVWRIEKIESVDGAMHHEDCTVTLANQAGETRTVKGSSLRSGYQFDSPGDVPEDVVEAAVTEAPARDDLQYMTVHIDGIREFYPRKHESEGSRVMMNDKTAYVVADTTSDINKMIVAAGGKIVGIN